jgi:hypothetical protein
MQAPEFVNEKCLHVRLLVLRNTLRCRPLNAGQWVKLRLPDDVSDGLFDEVTPGQATWVWDWRETAAN